MHITTQPMSVINMNESQLNQICEEVKLGCSANNIQVYKIKKSKDSIYYSISDDLIFSKLIKKDNKILLMEQWDFKEYEHQHIESSDDEGTAYTSLKIYPALYPLNKNSFAIAILSDWFGGYSGGGRQNQYADFLMLKEKGKYKRILGDINFYSSEMIRACFSEKDYHTSPHYHDESGTVLKIEVKDKGQKHYQWVLNYIDYDWPGFVPESQKKIVKRSVNATLLIESND